jgi:macrodomain Ter protein organizer (MatP/YcbG family)
MGGRSFRLEACEGIPESEYFRRKAEPVPTRKFAISVPEAVMRHVDRAARRRGMTRSRFVSHVLARVAEARTDAEISRRVDALFADPALAREQRRTARAFRRRAGAPGTEW